MEAELDFYRRFESFFFYVPGNPSSEERERVRETAGEDYRKLLEDHSITLERVLGNVDEPTTLNEQFFRTLFGLMRRETPQGSMIRKTVDADHFNPATILDTLSYNKLSQLGKRYIGGRVESHLARLADPFEYWRSIIAFSQERDSYNEKKAASRFCRPFVESVLGYLLENKELTLDEAQKINDKRIGREGGAILQFWTLVPYVYADLRQRGTSEEDSIRKIFSWIKMAPGTDVPFQPPFMPFHNQFSIGGDRVLGFDERMPSHLRVRLVGKAVAQRVSML